MDLDAIEAAEKVMTPRSWSYGESGGDQWIEHLGEESVATFEDIIESEEDLKGIALLRNSAPEMVARIRSQAAEIERLRRFAADHSKTCYSCESCGHARTTRECLWCENKRLRRLCEDEAMKLNSLSHLVFHGEQTETLSDQLMEISDTLFLASKGGQ